MTQYQHFAEYSVDSELETLEKGNIDAAEQADAQVSLSPTDRPQVLQRLSQLDTLQEELQAQQASLVQVKQEQELQGYREGYALGMQTAEAEANSQQLQSLLAQERLVVTLLARLQPKVITIVETLAEEVLGEALPLGKTRLQQRLQRILDNLSIDSYARVYIHPELSRELRSELERQLRPYVQQIEAHPALAPGTIEIVTDEGSTQLSVSVHIQKALQLLREDTEVQDQFYKELVFTELCKSLRESKAETLGKTKDV